MPVILTGTLRCRDAADTALVAELIGTHVALTRAEAGCVSFNVAQTDDPLIWQVDEEFVDAAAFEAHQARAKASEWGQRSAAIPRDFKVTGL